MKGYFSDSSSVVLFFYLKKGIFNMLRLIRGLTVIRQKHKFTDLEWSYYKELEEYFSPLYKTFTPYQDKVDAWKNSLERRQKRKERTKTNNESKPVTAAQPPKLVVHDPALGVALPLDPKRLFMVCRIGPSLHKLTQGAYLTLRNTGLELQAGESLTLTDVRLVGG